MEEKKKGKGLVVTLVIFILISLGLGGYIVYDKVLTKEEVKTEKKGTKKKINKQVDMIKDLDINKPINTNGYNYSNPQEVGDTNAGLSMEINSDKKTVTLSIDWGKFGPLSTASTYANEVKQYQINGFNKEIKNTFVGNLGQDSMGITLIFLMEDGTVEYMPMFNKKDDQSNSYYEINYTYEYSTDNRVTGEHFETNGTVNNVKNVIKLYSASVSVPNGGGAVTVIGATKDGSFYDIGNEINK